MQRTLLLTLKWAYKNAYQRLFKTKQMKINSRR